MSNEAKVKHTPGPWQAGENDAYKEGSGDSNFLVVRPAGEFMHGGWIADCGRTHNDEQRANAHLIAAAPDLLLACKENTLFLDELAKAWGLPDHVRISALKRAMEAITKAEGGNQ